jgi:hypothetical protein
LRLKSLKQLERDDLQRRAEAARTEERALRRAERRAEWEARWPRWTAWWEARSKELKIAATVVGAVGTIAVGATATGRWAAHIVRRAWSFYADRGVGTPAQPPPSGGASLAVDRVDPPKPPPIGGRR